MCMCTPIGGAKFPPRFLCCGFSSSFAISMSLSLYLQATIYIPTKSDGQGCALWSTDCVMKSPQEAEPSQSLRCSSRAFTVSQPARTKALSALYFFHI